MIIPPIDPNLEERLSGNGPQHDDARFAAGKITAFQYTTLGIFLFLIGGFWRLQVQNPQVYDERALQNSIKSFPIPAPRGRIRDRDGRIIVDNHSSFTVWLGRENLKEPHLKPIADGLDLEYSDLVARVQKVKSQPKYVPVRIKSELSAADLAFIDSHRDFFPEMEVIQIQSRLYPQNGVLAHVIGYTGEISEEDLDLPEFARYKPGQVIGKFGIERQYNAILTGVDGQRLVVVDHNLTEREKLATKEAIPGRDLRLTIDLDMQAVAELAMEGKNGAVVALDPRNGEVLTMVSRPAFDPNKFRESWKELLDNPDHPLMNRAIQEAQAPGSTFKPIMAMAALETGIIDTQFSVHCPGGATYYGRYYRCHLKTGHGTVTLHRGIVDSCDTYFYAVGDRLGIDKIAFYGDLFGYGRATGIDLPHEAAGVMPSSQWKIHNQHDRWFGGETINVAIGQGALTVTPLQLTRAMGGLAMGGVWYRPHLVKQAAEPPVVHKFNRDHLNQVIDAMYGVVNEAGGTGTWAELPGIQVCGKTGTAQVASADFVRSQGNVANLKDNAWFVGFAPCQSPEIVVTAFFEHGVESKFAAPIVRDVMKAYFDKKARAH
ncbi:Peptidoglycan glycosyltransferase [Candidatus Sulfopaludibacter sp. SbA3]|nr:Peptidoglycan glycosyltransferase [Candidatus Sulfopaludibacter sp. SbA3]